MPKEPIEDGLEGGTNEGISRRKMLGRIGMATAIAWSAPIVTSLKTPAFAAGVSPGACPPWSCGDTITQCGGTPCNQASNQCICDDDVDRKPFCWNDISCFNPGVKVCESNADCAGIGSGNWRCTTNCCGQTCLPPCGECGVSGLIHADHGQTAAGV